MNPRKPFGSPEVAEQAGRLWKVAEVAAFLRVHPKDVYQLGLPCIRFGRRLRFDPGDVLRWVSARKEG